MDSLEGLKYRIEEKLDAAKRGRLRQHQLSNQREMAIAERERSFATTANRIMEGYVRPRLEQLIGYFANAELHEDAALHCGIHCQHTPSLPADMKLGFFVKPDGAVNNAIVQVHLEVSPVTVPYKGQQEFFVALNNDIDERRLTNWLDDRLCEFVDIYLQIETEGEYPEECMAVDPVCGMRVVMEFAAGKADYQGVTYYFCMDECRRRFSEAPEKILQQSGV